MFRFKIFQSISIVIFFGALSCTKKPEKNFAKTVKVAIDQTLSTLDPALANDRVSATLLAYTYEGLYQYHYLKRPYEVIPALAESLPEIKDGGSTYLIKLKPGTLFHDNECFTEGKGREFVASDVVYSLKRLADPRINSPAWGSFIKSIKGLSEWREKILKKDAVFSDFVDGLRAISRYEVQITLTQSMRNFLYFLASPNAFIVPHEAIEKHRSNFYQNPVGTGPFVLSKGESSFDKKIIWKRNPTFRQEAYPSSGVAGDRRRRYLIDSGKSLPLSDRVAVSVFSNDEAKWKSFLLGDLDISTVPRDHFDKIVSPAKHLNQRFQKMGLKLQKLAKLDLTYISFNLADPILGKNINLRKALSHSFDSEKYIDVFYNGRAIPAHGPIPPGLEGYDPKWKNPYSDFNLIKAKKHLALAGYPDGKNLAPIEILSLDTTTAKRSTEFLERSFAAIGVKTRIKSLSWVDFQASIQEKKNQIWHSAWHADYPDSENFFQLFYGQNVGSSGVNTFSFRNQEFDRHYEKIVEDQNVKSRVLRYKRMVKILSEEAPVVFSAHRIQYALNHPWLLNFKFHEFDFGNIKYLRVDVDQKTHFETEGK